MRGESIDIRRVEVEEKCDEIKIYVAFFSSKKGGWKDWYTYTLRCEDFEECLKDRNPHYCLAEKVLWRAGCEYCRPICNKRCKGDECESCISKYIDDHDRLLIALEEKIKYIFQILCDSAKICKTIKMQNCRCLRAAFHCIQEGGDIDKCMSRELQVEIPPRVRIPKPVTFYDPIVKSKFIMSRFDIEYKMGKRYIEIYAVTISPYTGIKISKELTYEEAREIGLATPYSLQFVEKISPRLARRLNMIPGTYRFITDKYIIEKIGEDYYAVAHSPYTGLKVYTKISKEYAEMWL